MDAKRQAAGVVLIIGLISVGGAAFSIYSELAKPAHHAAHHVVHRVVHHVAHHAAASDWSPSLGRYATVEKYAILCRSKGVLQRFDKRITQAVASNDKIGADHAFEEALESGCNTLKSATPSALVINEDPAVFEPSIARVRLPDGQAYWVRFMFLKPPDTASPTP